MTAVADYQVSREIPPPDTYLRLRQISGLSPKTQAAAQVGLARSLCGVVVRQGEQIVGMGRAIGDGALFAQIVDIAVDPAHQGRGLGKAIMSELMAALGDVAVPGIYVSLIADGEAWKLYRQYGFEPTAPKSLGMHRILDRG